MITENSAKRSFDPDLSPCNEANRDVAENRGLAYDHAEDACRDEDGCPVLDHFGQPLG